MTQNLAGPGLIGLWFQHQEQQTGRPRHSLRLSNTVWFCLILSDSIWHCQILSNTVWVFLGLSDCLRPCQILSDADADTAWESLIMAETRRRQPVYPVPTTKGWRSLPDPDNSASAGQNCSHQKTANLTWWLNTLKTKRKDVMVEKKPDGVAPFIANTHRCNSPSRQNQQNAVTFGPIMFLFFFLFLEDL